MGFKNFRDASRSAGWGAELTESQQLNLEQLQTGCLLRIADAADSFNSFIRGLINDRDRYKAKAERLENQNRGLRGEITKLKRKLEAKEEVR